jgi:hypothetical protein
MRKFSAPLLALCASLIPAGASFASEVTPVQQLPRQEPVSANRTQWIGFAVSPNGRVFQSDADLSEGNARQIARTECEENTARTCRAIAVPYSWSVSVVVCSGDSFVAGVQEGSAKALAVSKADNEGVSRCRETFTY